VKRSFVKKKIKKKKKRMATMSLISLLLPCFDQRNTSSTAIPYRMSIAKNDQSLKTLKKFVSIEISNNIEKNNKPTSKKPENRNKRFILFTWDTSLI
jgi:hypothetical protein